jgi:hypothetical protein
VEVVAVAGLPGSGKSWLIGEKASDGFIPRDDMNINWPASMASVRAWLAQGRLVIVSDIEFCKPDWRARLEAELRGVAAVRWIFFANEPYTCIRNVLFRNYVEGVNRQVREEVGKIRDYAKIYRPAGDIRPVVMADSTPTGLVGCYGGRENALRWLRSMSAAVEGLPATGAG